MPQFQTNLIYLDQETVAEQLRATRQATGWELSAIAQELKINLEYLQALETNRYQNLPAGIYGLNFLRAYADFLGLDYSKLRRKFLEEKEVYQSQKQPKLFARQVVDGKYFWAMPRLVKGVLIALVALACFLYLGFLLRGFFVPPQLIISSPRPNLVTDQDAVVVSGRTDPETEVMINQAQVIVDTQGNFTTVLNLRDGVNVITITAQRHTKKQTAVVREVLRQQQSEPALPPVIAN